MEIAVIQNKIYEIRGCQVMLDFDLAKLYGTETSLLKRAVRRNIERFPEDFMFELTKKEANDLISSGVFQNGTPQYNFSAYSPFAFTEQGVAMLSSVLRSNIAIEVNIAIMRAFVSVRQYVLSSEANTGEMKELRNRILELEQQGPKAFKMIERLGEETMEAINDLSEDYRKELDDIYLALSQLAAKQKDDKKKPPRKPIGFKTYEDDK
ncbi:ORF6N domain-containing protein [uncultured Bacteroides sp.]|uniref:ORF6N domain-containing protein n=1 Tax=uncultured Bacteroides sp. TaxID=162156 RepID=UPI002AAB48ED|nr:ORF6N domain-containing protein [uncultured Bacteroides sp.]